MTADPDVAALLDERPQVAMSCVSRIGVGHDVEVVARRELAWQPEPVCGWIRRVVDQSLWNSRVVEEVDRDRAVVGVEHRAGPTDDPVEHLDTGRQCLRTSLRLTEERRRVVTQDLAIHLRDAADRARLGKAAVQSTERINHRLGLVDEVGFDDVCTCGDTACRIGGAGRVAVIHEVSAHVAKCLVNPANVDIDAG